VKLLRLRQLHRWVALVVGLQVLVWTASGLMFAWLDQGSVAGEGLAEAPVPTALPATADLLEPARLPFAAATPVVSALELRMVDGRWVYRVETDAGVRLLRASDGAPVAVDAAVARRLAASHYRGQGRLRTVKLHATETLETRELGPAWEAAFDDDSGTRLYFSDADGSLVAVRTDAWRLKDLFWMLHTMDYRGRDDFNNPLVMVAGTAAAWVGLTGLWLLARVMRPRREGKDERLART
jgi:Na+-transporting NADH:ubiquinone oxidoreductase subunit F